MSDSENCATTNPLLSRRLRRVAEPRVPLASASCIWMRDARSPGARPHSTPVTTLTTIVNSNTVGSSRT
jgi:hypothetical protein